MPAEKSVPLPPPLAKVDSDQEFLVIETFTRSILGTFDTEAEAIDKAKVENRTASGDSVYIIAKNRGRVVLGEYEKASFKPGPVVAKTEEPKV